LYITIKKKLQTAVCLYNTEGQFYCVCIVFVCYQKDVLKSDKSIK
jgi:hypothetical protein